MRNLFLGPAHSTGLVVLLVLTSGTSITACTSMLTPLGSDKYDCNRKENPDSPYCHSFKSVVRGTDGPVPDSRYDEVMRMSDHDRLTGIAPTDKPQPGAKEAIAVSGPHAVLSPPQATGSAPHDAGAHAIPNPETPVRMGPLVQRVWIKRYVDRNDMLVSNTFVYKEIVPPHWAGFSADAPGDGHGSPASYPHRVAPAPEAAAPAKATNAPKPTTNEFVQPGQPAAQANVVPVPTTPNGTSSMPQ